jgi:hypothetical protein
MKQLETAVAVLRETLDKPENPRLATLWAQTLMPFRSDQLAEAFNTVALTSKGWPTLGDITEPILDAEYAADWAWIIQGLRRHGVNWQAKPARYGPQWRKPGAGIDDWEPGPLLEAEIPAPEIPRRLVECLARIGGLVELAKHPAIGVWQWEPAEAQRIKFQVERDFKAAWMAVRKRELGGGV